jgi:hypothetical protein
VKVFCGYTIICDCGGGTFWTVIPILAQTSRGMICRLALPFRPLFARPGVMERTTYRRTDDRF